MTARPDAVVDNQAAERFELQTDVTVAIAAYQREPGRIIFTHTEVPAELEGRGIGSALIAGALDQVRSERLKVVPACAFVRAYIERHPEEQDLLA